MYVDWEYYKIFYYVAKYQNFTRAARVLGNNQPNITHTMNKLEDQLHCVLFIRSNRGVTLTPEGETLYARIASAAVQIQDAEAELSASATLEHGAISISATETALNICLSERLQAFHAQYPGIRAATVEPLDAAGHPGREKRRGRFRRRDHPRRAGRRTENGRADALQRNPRRRADLCAAGGADTLFARADRLPTYHAGQREYEPHVLPPVFLGKPR